MGNQREAASAEADGLRRQLADLQQQQERATSAKDATHQELQQQRKQLQVCDFRWHTLVVGRVGALHTTRYQHSSDEITARFIL